MSKYHLGIVFGFFLFGIGLGFLLSPHLGFVYGMPAGIFIGIGIGVVVQQFSLGIVGSKDTSSIPSNKKKGRNG
jgi:hypothetical protein